MQIQAQSAAEVIPLSRQQVRVLIVDDVPANLDALEAILLDTGFDITRANSGSEALQRLLQAEYACCLLDIRMPNMDGYETAQLIRQDAHLKHLPIIFVTAEASDQQDIFKGYDSGAIDFLIKPLEPVIVRNKVQVFGELYLQKYELTRSKAVEALNKMLDATNKALRAANTDLEHFTHIAAHDLREPLRQQRNLLDLLQDDFNGDKTLSAELIEHIMGCSDQMLDMIDDFRTLTKIGYSDLQREPTDIQRLIEECLNNFNEQIAECQPTVEFHSGLGHVEIYVSLVKILYINLIKNVFDHVDGTNFRLVFTVEPAASSTNQRVYGVKNTGTTIEQSQLNEIFKMFRKAESGHIDGSGIGLSICRRVIDRHHGRIFAESGPDYVHIKFTFGEIDGH